ncbi:hypothetical protein B2I21_29045 [Chryseobacterium mucoviscidosis]|nr:hypothetical protein B2I21_29045 [Chryseobacterium mucoviscidosis]
MAICFRIAVDSDIWNIYEWSNDKTTREMSFNSNTISESEHQIWFDKILFSEDCYLYIVEDALKNNQLGYVRLDQNGIVSISIDKQFRGQGLGSIVLIEFINFVKGISLHCNKFTALIKVKNTPSIKSFEKVGFTLKGHYRHEGEECLLYEYDLS